MILNSGPGKIYNITGCTGSCTLPKFRVSVIERGVFDAPDSPDDHPDSVRGEECVRMQKMANINSISDASLFSLL